MILPRFAIVTPSFNTGRHVGAAVRSVLEQDYADFDYLVMDGGSTDETLEVLKGFDGRVRWMSQKDRGQADAIDRGFRQTNGEILAWLNSDDVLEPGALRAVAEFFAQNPSVDVVYGYARYIDAAGRFIAPCVHVESYSRHRLFCYSDFVVQPAAFFRRTAYEAVGGLDPNLHWSMDYDLWLKLAKAHCFVYLPRTLASFRWLSNNKTATGGWGRLDEIRRVLRRQGLRIPAFVRLERAHLYAWDAIHALGRGNLPRAAAAAGAAAAALGSPRVLKSLLSLHTWRVIWVGQVLRRRAVQEGRCETPVPLVQQPAARSPSVVQH